MAAIGSADSATGLGKTSTGNAQIESKKTSCACCESQQALGPTYTLLDMLQRKTPLARGPVPKRSRKGLCAQSRALRRVKAEQRKAYAAATDAEQCWCSACGKPGPTDHSHHFSQHQQRHLRNNELNWLKLCRSCHSTFENSRPRFAATYPKVWEQILASMREVDPAAYQQFEALHDELYPL